VQSLMADKKLDAIDIVNWDYFVEIAEYPAERPCNADQAVKGFAYDFTSTAKEEVRNQMLVEILRNGT
jgi:hypothetical protein